MSARADEDASTAGLLAAGLSQLTEGLAKIDRFCAHVDGRVGNKRAAPAELSAGLSHARQVVARLCTAYSVSEG